MATAANKTPRFLGPDGVLRENYIFTTDLSYRFFHGVMSPDTADMQVSIRGSGFTSDPDSIVFEGDTFTVPNPSAYPEGLQLFAGGNVIEVRSILTSGAVTASGMVQAELSLERDIKASVIAPSGVFVERKDRVVTVTVEGLEDPNVTGYHFYAATEPGGGTTGYKRINPTEVISSETIEDETVLAEMTVDSLIATNEDGSQAADPLFYRVVGEQTNQIGTVIQTDFDQAVEVPEVVRRVKTTVNINSIRQVQQFSFTHDRRATPNSSPYPALPNSEFNALPEEEPLYYVVTAVYFINNVEYESSFSPEVAASPLIVTPAISALPTVSRQQIVRDTVLSINRTHPEIDVKPGAVERDVFIDPFSTEAERIRFIVNFMQAAQSFATLLVIDDPGFSGSSIPVNQSSYKLALKQAFFLRTNDDVQNMIDNMFDQLAARRGVTRRPGNRSRGEVTYYTTQRPDTTRFMPIGTILASGGVRFRSTSAAQITTNGAQTTYNPQTGRFSARAFFQAESYGTAGNVAAGQISSIVSGPSGVQVVNEGAAFGGRDQESNRDLAARADRVLASVDSGTYQGYIQNAIEVPGVLQVIVVDADSTLMMRDFNPVTDKHVGGKVDVWIRGENLSSVTDAFAFSFEIVRRGQFEPVGNIQNLKFRAINTDITADNPIIEMLDNPDWGYEFKDATTGKVFDLTDVTVIAPDSIQLSADYNDPTNIFLTDVFTGDYRFRTSDRYVMTRQPVREVTSFEGQVSGVLSDSVYKLFPGSLPLEMGRSNEAGDYVKVIEPTDGVEPVEVPSGDPIVVTDEEHVMLSGVEYLNNLGINPITVRVYNDDRTVEYYGPLQPNVDPDFTFVDEKPNVPLGILPTAETRIVEGQTVLVDYQHDENFVVTYTYNSLVGVVQNDLNESRHVTADVLTKEAAPVGVDIWGTIVLHPNQTASTVDSAVRTALSRFFGTLVLGEPVRQGDIIDEIESVAGVSYAVIPLVRLAKTDGSLVIREVVATDQTADSEHITAWSSELVDVFLLVDPLESGTLNGGGEINDPRGVFANEETLTLYTDPPNITGIPLKNSVGGAFIIGNNGLYIPGYSDDLTLKQQFPFATDAEIDDKRKEITQRRILVSLAKGQTPVEFDYTTTYVVYGDEGVQNIEPGLTEFLELGDLDFSYDEDADRVRLLTGGNRRA